MSADVNPLSSPPPSEIPLGDAPLVRVIAQVRFPLILAVDSGDGIASFQKAVGKDYPDLRQEVAHSLVVGAQGIAPNGKRTLWRFTNADSTWRLSLSADFLALETTTYTSRSDLLTRLRAGVEALNESVEPALVHRLGVRYIDRITGPALDNIHDLVRAELLGIVDTVLKSHATHALSEALFDVPNSSERLLARWGLLPAGSTPDPAAIESIDEPSWLLDIDMFSGTQRSFEPDAIVADVQRYAERSYAFFRWAVTAAFLKRYGGKE